MVTRQLLKDRGMGQCICGPTPELRLSACYQDWIKRSGTLV